VPAERNLKMQAPLKEKNDIKIFILYLMRNIGYPLDFSNINDIVVQDGIVNYFDFAECFAELIDMGNISESKDESGETVYAVTEQGKQVADNLQSDILMMIRENSLKSALRLLSFKKRGSQIKCKSQPQADGSYLLNCSIIESREEIMNLTLKVDNKKQLDRMEYTFNQRPEFVYRGLMAVLTGEVNYLID
jgi:predicted transcriptional regulator